MSARDAAVARAERPLYDWPMSAWLCLLSVQEGEAKAIRERDAARRELEKLRYALSERNLQGILDAVAVLVIELSSYGCYLEKYVELPELYRQALPLFEQLGIPIRREKEEEE